LVKPGHAAEANSTSNVEGSHYARPKSLDLGPSHLFKEELDSKLKAGLASNTWSPPEAPLDPPGLDFDSVLGVELGPRGTLKKMDVPTFANLADIDGEPNLAPWFSELPS